MLLSFGRQKKINVEIVSKLFAFSLAGAAIGVKTAVSIDPSILLLFLWNTYFSFSLCFKKQNMERKTTIKELLQKLLYLGR